MVTETYNGQRHQCTFTGDREGERQAREYAAQRQAELNETIFSDEVMGRQPKRTFLEVLERWEPKGQRDF